MNKELFLQALLTLFGSWGGDPAPEVYWAANDFLKYFEAVNNINLGIQFEEPCEENGWEPNFDEVCEKIKQI